MRPLSLAPLVLLALVACSSTSAPLTLGPQREGGAPDVSVGKDAARDALVIALGDAVGPAPDAGHDATTSADARSGFDGASDGSRPETSTGDASAPTHDAAGDAEVDAAEHDAADRHDAASDAAHSTDAGNAACTIASDCTGTLAGDACIAHVCVAPTCSDGVQDGDETGVDCGGPACDLCPVVIFLASGPTSSSGFALGGVLGGEYHPAGTWATTNLSAFSPDDVGLTIAGKTGVGLVHYANRTNTNDPLNASVLYATWSPGKWVDFAAVGTGVTTRAQPSIGASGQTAPAVFQGTDYYYYGITYDAAAKQWSAVSSTNLYGPLRPALAPLGANATLAFVDGNNDNLHDLRATDDTGGAWESGVTIDGTAGSFTIAPTLVALRTGPELLVVGVDSNGLAYWSSRTAGVWSSPTPLPNVYPASPVALAALPSGGAFLAFQGTDNNLYTLSYANGAWGVISSITAASQLVAAPSVTHGVGTATVELAYVSTTAQGSQAFHTRLIAGAWTAPMLIGGPDLAHIALASAP